MTNAQNQAKFQVDDCFFECWSWTQAAMVLGAFLTDFTSLATQGVWVGIAVGIGVLFYFSRGRSLPAFQPILLLNSTPIDPFVQESLDQWIDPKLKADERRIQARREGKITPIELASLDGRQRQHAVVLDRNSTGLKIAVANPPGQGSEVLLLADHAPSGTPHVRAKVCWIKSNGKHSEIGCRYSESIPTSILLLFG